MPPNRALSRGERRLAGGRGQPHRQQSVDRNSLIQCGRQEGRLRPGPCGLLLNQPSEGCTLLIGPPLSPPKGPPSLSLPLVPHPWPTSTQPSAPLVFPSFGKVSLGHFLTLPLSCCAPCTLWAHHMEAAELRCHTRSLSRPRPSCCPPCYLPAPVPELGTGSDQEGSECWLTE